MKEIFIMLMEILSLLLLSAIESTVEYGFCEDLKMCNCYIDDTKFVVDCSGKEMNRLPDNIPEEAQILLCTDNDFQELPDNLNSLQNLEEINFADNQIRSISKNALGKLLYLRKINLSRNRITSLSDINANNTFILATQLTELDLSHNPITLENTSSVIQSSSLQILNLNHCNISNFRSPTFLKYMPKLEILDISYNPIHEIRNLHSSSLIQLEASHCQLGFFDGNLFPKLKKLMILNLSWNQRLHFSRDHSAVNSESLKELDVSFCNIERLKLELFPGLIKLVASGNIIRKLNEGSFENNHRLEHINLTGNAIYYISERTFDYLDQLRILDLSWNVLSYLHPNMFNFTKHISSINLSRNHLSRLDIIISDSIISLDVSWCEIQHITEDAFLYLPELRNLDLSHNLISEVPDDLKATKLQTINLNFCRLKSIKNKTLQGLPYLSSLLLAGNRLTTPFEEGYFSGNRALKEIDLSDNPWRCECHSESFKSFYKYLRPKVDDSRSLKCESPNDVAGKTWSSACNTIWNPNLLPVSKSEKIWMFLMVSMLSFLGTMCVVMSVRRAVKARAEAARLEEERAAEEIRQRERRQRRIEHQSQQNAPDPRDLVSPPCYEEALLMPRLDGSFASLGHLPSGSRVLQNRMAKNRAKSEANVSKLTSRTRNISPLTITIAQDDSTHSAVHINTETINDSSSSSAGSDRINSNTVLDHESANLQQTVSRQIPNSPPPKYTEINCIPIITNAIVESRIEERVRHESDL